MARMQTSFASAQCRLVFVAPVSEYRSSDVEANKCRHAVCICDMEMVRCMKHYKDTFSSDNVGWVTSQHKSCAVTGGQLRPIFTAYSVKLCSSFFQFPL